MKSALKLLFLPLLVLCTGSFLTACDKDAPTPPEPPARQGRQTVLIFMAAQNSLGAGQYSVRDSTEIMNGAPYLKDGDHVLLYIDDERAPRLYDIARGYAAPKLVRQWKEDLNSGDPNTLNTVLDIMKSDFPSDEYGLVLWSHADGWLPGARNYRDAHAGRNGATATRRKEARRLRPSGYGMDVGPNGDMRRDRAELGDFPYEMSIEGLAAALKRSGLHFRFIHNDCCEMQCIEVAYALRDVADYVAGSPMQIAAEGGFYTDMLRWGYFSPDIADLGKTYVDYYLGKGSRIYTDNFGVVFSILRTADLQPLADSLAAVLPQNLPATKSDGMPNYPNLRNVQPYARYSSFFFFRPEFFDMSESLRVFLAPADYAKVKAALDKATVFKGTTRFFYTGLGIGQKYWRDGSWWNAQDYNDAIFVDESKYCGVSMFVPQKQYAENAARCPQGDLNRTFRETEWYTAAGWKAAGW